MRKRKSKFQYSLRSYLVVASLVAIGCSLWATLPWASFEIKGDTISVTSVFPCTSVCCDKGFRLADTERAAVWWRWLEDRPTICLRGFKVRFHGERPKFIVLGTPVGHRYYAIVAKGEGVEFRQAPMPKAMAEAFAQ